MQWGAMDEQVGQVRGGGCCMWAGILEANLRFKMKI